MACVYVPVQNSEEEVPVVLDQLPKEANDIIDILEAEQASLDLWLIIARKYFKQGKLEQFRQILDEDIDEYYSDIRYERIAILNALGAYNTYLGKIETKQREKEEHFILATQFFNKASRIDIHEPSTWVGKGEVDQAFSAFKIVLDGDRDNVTALLGQACVEFNRGHYSDSLDLYKRALQVHPDCPAAVRLGIGLCCYKMGQFDKARQVFERVLQGDYDKAGVYYMASVKEISKPHEFVFPYYGLGQVQLKMGYLRSSLSNFEKVLEVYPVNSDTLKVLGHVYVQLGQTEKALEFMRKATKVDPNDSQALLDLGELLISFDAGAALDCLKTAAQSTDRRRRAFSESGDDEQQPESIPVRENSAELHSDGEGREGGGDKQNGDADLDDED